MNIRIIVPVFNAYHVLKELIVSLRTHNPDDDILFINDASTDVRVTELLSEIPSNWKVMHNLVNLGFVKTANKGLRSTAGHSILLNSDTLVTKGWLTNFKQAINQIDNLGTATPWSNNAEICSFPKTLQDNEVPHDMDQFADDLASHRGSYPEIPTAVGFCMLITEQAKQKVGYFDEQTFGMGYGEENDYSLRVTQAGLRNVLLDNCYVVHVGNQSFQEIALKPNKETMERLLAKHPKYLEVIQKFIENDPLCELRQSIIAKISTFNKH